MKTMYSFFVLLAACCMAHGSLFAQDRIITNKGDVMEVYNVEVSDKYIFFNRDKSVDSVIERLAKDSVLMIRRQDGAVVNLNGADAGTAAGGADVQAVSAEASQLEAIILTPDMLDEQARQVNAASIARMNAPVMFEPKKPEDLEKKANCVWYRMGVKENSVLDDGTVSLELKRGNFERLKSGYKFKEGKKYWHNPGVQVCVSNKSDRTVYIDLAKCFFTRMGQPQCYYVPSATSVTSTSSSGIGVNMGAVAGALGVGGIVGTLASGVNVGGGGSKGSTTVTYAQRMISVPPHTTVKLEPQFLFGTDNLSNIITGLSYGAILYKMYTLGFNFPKDASEGPLMNGQHLSYDEVRSILPVSALVAYSFSEDGCASRTLSAHLYLKDVVGVRSKKGDVHVENSVIGYEGFLFDSKGKASFPRK